MRLVLGYLAVLWGQDNLAGSINEVSRYMGQIPQDGKNEQYVALFFIFDALL